MRRNPEIGVIFDIGRKLSNKIALLEDHSLLRNEREFMTLPASNPYISAATSPNTRRAYQADIRHFETWGGHLPTNMDTLLIYLQVFAKTLNPRTLSRRLTALRNWHIYQGFSDPTQPPAVSKTLAGITRTHGKPKDKASPLLPEHLLKIAIYLSKENTLYAARDNALLQLAFFGAFRRSEIVAIEYEHLAWQDQGIDILIPHSKTDQINEGQYCAVPYGNEQLCPLRALKRWLEQSKITSGPLFRRIRPQGHLDKTPLVPLTVSNILKNAHVKQKFPKQKI